MKTKNFSLVALLFAIILSSCSDDSLNYPSLTTQDFISMYGMTEAELDSKMSGYSKSYTSDGDITYSRGNNIFVSAYDFDENFLSISLSNGVASLVSLLHQEYPTTFFNKVESDLIAIYPNVTPVEYNSSGIYLTTFNTGVLRIRIMRSTSSGSACLFVDAQ
ncbi:MAG: hypothetical protein R3Y59_10750 [bacterium]